jgi:hypothetical protein
MENCTNRSRIMTEDQSWLRSGNTRMLKMAPGAARMPSV